MRVCVVAGVRPHFLKLGRLSSVFRERRVDFRIIRINQQVVDGYDYYEQLDKSVICRDLMAGSFSYGGAGKFIEESLRHMRARICLVIGDTKTTYVGAVAANRAGVRLVHFEAGMRSLCSSGIEDRIRSAVDRRSDVLICCHESDRINLIREGRDEKGIFVAGSLYMERIYSEIICDENVNHLDRSVCLVTIHRKENLRFSLLKDVVESISLLGVPVKFVVHDSALDLLQNLRWPSHVAFHRSMSRRELLECLCRSLLVVTDSAGLSEEAVVLRVPTVVVRSDTERPWLLGRNCVLASASEIFDAAARARREFLPLFPLPRHRYVSDRIAEVVGRLALAG
ncbi:hypothetical protein DY468_14870 [Rhodopseudomonas sp. BR0M22]|nr:hypothetical protein [Rhodopseudomonas sp. BR0M22]